MSKFSPERIEAPKYKEAGTYTTYYKASLPGYTTISGAKEVTIGKKVVNLDLSKTSGQFEGFTIDFQGIETPDQTY